MSDLVHEAKDESAWLVSSCCSGRGYIGVCSILYLRLETKDVGNTVRLVSSLIGFRVDTSDVVDKMNGRHPLLNGQLDLPREVVEMPYQSAQNPLIARCYVGAHCIEDMLGETGVEPRRLRSLSGVRYASIIGWCHVEIRLGEISREQKQKFSYTARNG